MKTWPQLSMPIFALDNTRIAQQMSVMVGKDGKVPDFEAVVYALQASEDAGDYQPIPYADRRL